MLQNINYSFLKILENILLSDPHDRTKHEGEHTYSKWKKILEVKSYILYANWELENSYV